MKTEEELREECDFVLDELKCARVTVLANGGLELEGQRTVAAPENRPATEFHDGVYNEIQKFVRIGLAADEFSALIIDEYVCIEGYGYSALENGGPLIVGRERTDWGYNSSVAAFSLTDLRNGLELGDLTDDYRAYAAALLGAGVMDTRVWRRMFASGIPAEYAATLYAQAAA